MHARWMQGGCNMDTRWMQGGHEMKYVYKGMTVKIIVYEISKQSKIFFQAYTRYNLYLDINYQNIINININNLKKKPTKFNYKNTTPGEQKGEVIVYSVQSKLRSL